MTAATFETLRALNDRETTAGFHPLTPWWQAQLERFYGSDRKRFAARVGRGGVKSTTMVDVALNETLFGDWRVPPGEVHWFAFVSQNKSEAGARLRQIDARLRALGLPFEPRGDEIILPELRRGFRIFACQVGAVSGPRCFGWCADEVAKWTNADDSANPAPEVVASLRAMTVTHPDAREFIVSSPFGVDDLHHEIIETGDTADQCVGIAPTWIANPSVTEEQTHRLEPDPRVWAREYAAIPGATVNAAVDAADVAASFGLAPTGRLTRGFVAIDASSLRGDAFAWIAGRETDAGELAVLEVDAFDGERLRSVSMRDVVRYVADRARAWGAATVYADQREEASLKSMFVEERVGFESFAWSEPSKDAAVQLMRRLLRERRLCLVEHAGLRRELGSMKAHLLPSGRTKYATNGLDFASALVTLLHAAVEQRVLVSFDLEGMLRANGIADRHDRGSSFEPPLRNQDNGTRWGSLPGRGF